MRVNRCRTCGLVAAIKGPCRHCTGRVICDKCGNFIEAGEPRSEAVPFGDMEQRIKYYHSPKCPE